MNIRPAIGVGIIISHNNKILLGKRINSHGSSTWAPPGGHLEFGETPEECAQREVMEEVGIKITNLRRGHYTNDIFIDKQKHYITLFFFADYESGTIQNCEPHKCEGWEWFDSERLPQPLFLPLQHYTQQYPLSMITKSTQANFKHINP